MMATERHLSQRDYFRLALHQDVDVVFAAWPLAVDDVAARGYPTSAGGSAPTGSHTAPDDDATSRAAVRKHRATAWLAELGDVLAAFRVLDLRVDVAASLPSPLLQRLWHYQADNLAGYWPNRHARQTGARLARLADAVVRYWPATPEGGVTVGGVTVGERGNRVEVCGLCGDPCPSGKSEKGENLLRRDKDGQAFHAMADPSSGRGACFWIVSRQRAAAWKQRQAGEGE